MPTDGEYLSLEAARFFNYTLSAWRAEDVDTQGRAIAHYLEHGMREGYASELAEADAKLRAKEDEKPAPGLGALDRFRKAGRGSGG